MTRRYGLWLDLWEPIQNLLPGRFGTVGRTLWTTASLWKQFYIDRTYVNQPLKRHM